MAETLVPPGETGFDAVVAQLLAADPDVLYRRAAAIEAVIAELETARDGLRREVLRVQEAMRGASADGFTAEAAEKVAAVQRSLDAIRTWPPALRTAGDELARARSAAMSLREQRAAWAGHPGAADVEEAFAAAARAELARVSTALGSAGGAQQPIAAVPPSLPVGQPGVVAASATTGVPQVVPAAERAAAPRAGVPGLTAPGPEAIGASAPGSVPAASGAVPEGAPGSSGAPAGPAVAPTAFALAGGTIGTPGTVQAPAAPTGTLQSAPVVGARTPTAAAPGGVLGRPVARAVVPAAPSSGSTDREGLRAPEPLATEALEPATAAETGDQLPGGVAAGMAGGVLGRSPAGEGTRVTPPTSSRERTDALGRESRTADPARSGGAVEIPDVAVAGLGTPVSASAQPSTGGGPGQTPRMPGPVPDLSGPGVPVTAPASSTTGTPRGLSLPVTGDAAAIANLPVAPPTPDPRSAGRLPLSPASGGVPPAAAGGASSGMPFMPMGAGMSGAMNPQDERTRDTSLTADPSNWHDEGVPGVLGRT